MSVQSPLQSPQSSPELSPETAVCGVYLLFLDERLIYVGQSRHCHVRIAQHRSAGRVFDHVLVAPCAEADREWLEASLIAAWAASRAVDNANQPLARRRLTVGVLLPGEDATTPLTKTKARARAVTYQLGPAFDHAYRRGEFAFEPGDGNYKVMELGELLAWATRTHEAKYGK